MRRLKNYFLLLSAALMVFACKPDPVIEEQDPQAPVVESAELTGVNGEPQVRAGAKVKVTAKVSVQNSELDTYTISVMKGDELIGSASGTLKGTEATISETMTLAVSAATLEAEFTPVVTITVTNKDEQFTEYKVTNVAKICPPSLMDLLYLVDDKGAVFEMSPMKTKGNYRTYGDLSEIGESFTICEALTGDNKPDGSKQVWDFDTPSDEYVQEYGLRYLGFDLLNESMFKMVDHTLTLDFNKMSMDAKTYEVFWCLTLVPDSEIEFLNYPEGMLLQSDRFANVEENKARYTGNFTDKSEAYFIKDTNWFILKGQWSDNSVVWVTGANGSVPMVPYTEGHPLAWFEGNPNCAFSATSLVNTKGNIFKGLLYLKTNFEIKLYDYWSFANELQWTSLTPSTLQITPNVENPETGKVEGNFGLAGDSFKEGLWVLTYNKLSKEASLDPYTGTIVDPLKGVVKEPDPLPEADWYVVDNKGQKFPMELISGAKYRTKEATEKIGESFVIAQKVNGEGVIDWGGKVYGLVSGAFAEIAQGGDYIPVDPVYAVYNKAPWKINFNTSTKEMSYFDNLSKKGMADNGDGTSVRWVLSLPHNTEVQFTNFTKKVSEMVNFSVFSNIDDAAGTAIYTGASENYEVWMRNADEWIVLTNNIAKQQMLLIGKNMSFPQAPYTEYPLIDSDISKVCGQALPLNKIADGKYASYVYADSGFGFSIYAGRSWGDIKAGWTVLTPDYLATDGTFGFAGPKFFAGLYEIVFDMTNNTLSMSPKSSKPEEGPLESLYLVDANGNYWTMSLVNGQHFRADESCAGIASTFYFAEKLTTDHQIDWTGRVYGSIDGKIASVTQGAAGIPIDSAYGVYSKSPWLVGFDATAKEVIYKEGFWKGGMGDMGDGSCVIWVQTLPHNCEVAFFDFPKKVSEMVNLAVFDNIDDTNNTARYIGYSENYETYYRTNEGWLILSNNICAKQKLLIGKNASFGQAPYTDYPIIETDIPRTAGKTLPLNRLDENTYSAYIYMAADASFQLYTDYTWGALNQAWESDTPEIVTRESFYAKLGASFVPGLYQVIYKEAENTFSLIAK